MLRTLLILTAFLVPAVLGMVIACQIYRKKTATYMPLKNEFAHWTNQ